MPPSRWLVLCSAADRSAVWVHERLRERVRAPVSLLFTESLGDGAVHWEHRIGACGATTRITTADGEILRTADLRAVLNRLASPPLSVLATAVAEDREYARNELSAFAAGWLKALSATVVNAPHPHGLCGRWRSPLQWRALAGRAGMRCGALRLSSTEPAAEDPPATMLLAVDGHLLADGVPARVQQACARLAFLSNTRILGLRFAAPAPASWRFLDATPFPDLSLAGEYGVAAIEAALAS